jgi:glutamate-ammonia-ligase adenylyltransferase
LDVEFAVQCQQVSHRADPEVRATNTLEALRALAREGALDAATSEVLDEGYRFFREVEQALRFLDERTQPTAHLGSRAFTQLARRLGIRDRDGRSREEVLQQTWEHHARDNRRVFERLVGEVGTRPAWAASGVSA